MDSEVVGAFVELVPRLSSLPPLGEEDSLKFTVVAYV